MGDELGFRTDTSMWPLVLLRAARRPASDEEIQRFIDEQKVMLARNERFVELCDTRDVYVVPAKQRRLFGDFIRETDAQATALCAGLAVIVRNSVYQGGMTAILWLARPAYPVRPVTGLGEAEAFLQERAAATGIRLPPSALAYLQGQEPVRRSG